MRRGPFWVMMRLMAGADTDGDQAEDGGVALAGLQTPPPGPRPLVPPAHATHPEYGMITLVSYRMLLSY
jgi:hypothetical protein